MKLKNISFADRTLHKFAPIAALLFLLGVLYFYVLGTPYQVSMNHGSMSDSPEKVEEDIQRSAAGLDRKIKDSKNPLPPMKLIPYTEEFQARALRSLVGKTSFDVPLNAPGLDAKVFTPTPLPPSEYMVHLPPPATDVHARPTYGVLNLPGPDDVNNAWIKLAGNNEPRDIRIVTVTGTFDLAEWRRRLTSPPVGERIVIPENWWRPMLAITDVVLQRQQLDPATGQWGSVETLPPLPNNRFGYLRKEGDNFSGDNPLDIVHTIAANDIPITHAPPPPLTNDHPWVAPGAEVPHTPEQDKRLVELKDEIARLQEQHDHLGNPGGGQHPVPSTHTPTPHHGNPGSSGGSGGERPGSPERPAAQAQRPAAANAHSATDIAAEREKLAEQIRDLKDEQDALIRGKNYTKGQPAAKGGGGGAHHGGHHHVDVEAADAVEVWAHDITAKPGQTYRYRIQVSVIDPLFQRPNLNPQQRVDFYQTLALTSDADHDENEKYRGGWSEPVQIDRDSYFFLTNANAGGHSVTVTVWRLYGGKWQGKEFTVQPGDMIGQTATLPGFSKPVDMAVNAVAVDIDPASPTNRPLVRTTPKLIYLDTATGQLLSRTLLDDKEDPRYLRIRSESQTSGPVAEK